LSPGQWYHVAGTWNSLNREYRLYVNGVLDGVGVQYGNGINPSSSTTFKIGREAAGADRPFHGQIDEVRVWNIARTGDDIQGTMNQSVAGNEAGLVADYQFDEGAGTTTADKTANHNDGTLVNNPTWVASAAPVNATGAATVSAVIDQFSVTFNKDLLP